MIVTQKDAHDSLLARIEQQARAADIAIISYRDYLLLKDHFNDDSHALNDWATRLADDIGHPYFMTRPKAHKPIRSTFIPRSWANSRLWFKDRKGEIDTLMEESAEHPFTLEQVRDRLRDLPIPYVTSEEFRQLWQPGHSYREYMDTIRYLVEQEGRPIAVEKTNPTEHRWWFSKPTSSRPDRAGLRLSNPEYLLPDVTLAALRRSLEPDNVYALFFEGWITSARDCGGDTKAAQAVQQLAAEFDKNVSATVRSPVITSSVWPTGMGPEAFDRWWDPQGAAISAALSAEEATEISDFALVREHHPGFEFEHLPYKITQVMYQ